MIVGLATALETVDLMPPTSTLNHSFLIWNGGRLYVVHGKQPPSL